jgi:hypothetical protein
MSKIYYISIQRDMATTYDGIRRETKVCFQRHNGRKTIVSLYSNNPIAKPGKISEASVIRAKRAQIVLAERAHDIDAGLEAK